MTQYIVSARKYRPDNFETLVGQDNIARTLKNSIVRGKLAHAYLFCGPRGVGKTSTARIFAKTINCSNPTESMEPCGKCESCISFAEGRSYCIHELDAASNNGVEDIKALMEQVRIPPQIGKYSVYIIDEVHMLSQSAFNAFLKTLEEPPAHAIFILATTEKHKILPTILSRCQTYDFNRISIDDMVRTLKGIAEKENVVIDDESLHVIANKADGAMRDALTIFDQIVAFCGSEVNYQDVIRNLNVLDYEYCFSMVESFLRNDYPSALLGFDEILSKGFNALHFVAALSSHFRDLAVSKASGLDALLELPESLKAKYREQAGKCSVKFIYDALNITTQCESGYRASVNPRLHIEFALMKLCFLVKETKEYKETAVPQAETLKSQKTAEPGIPVRNAVKVEQKEGTADPRPRPRMNAAATGLSLKSVLEGRKDEVKPVKKEIHQSSAEISDELIREKWGELAEMFESRPRLANTLKSSSLSFKTEDNTKIVTFNVLNIAQKEWVEKNLLHEIEGKLQKLLSNSSVALRVDVEPDDDSKVPEPVLPREKARNLMENNPEVKNLVKDFGLEC